MKQLKQLQKDCTTPEQSQRLLELGVPMWTANCYMYNYWINGVRMCIYNITPWNNKEWWDGHRNDRYTPCWSVGRLIEIELICREQQEGMIPRLSFIYGDSSEYGLSSGNLIENLIAYLESGQYKYDFSKLEDELL